MKRTFFTFTQKIATEKYLPIGKEAYRVRKFPLPEMWASSFRKNRRMLLMNTL
nr:MAG TPA: hypothetical protein [Caudoviricetes sp.]